MNNIENDENQNNSQVLTENQPEELPKRRNISEEKNINKFFTNTTVVIIITTLVVLFCCVFIIFNVLCMTSDKLDKNIYILGNNYTQMTIEQAEESLNMMQNKLNTQKITLVYKDKTYPYLGSDFGITFNKEEILDDLISIKNSTANPFYKIWWNIKTSFVPKEFDVVLSCDDSMINNIFSSIVGSDEIPKKDFVYELKSDILYVSKGEKGISLDRVEAKNNILNNFYSCLLDNVEQNSINLELKEVLPQPFSINLVKEQICGPAKDAYLDKDGETTIIIPEKDGIDFSVSDLNVADIEEIVINGGTAQIPVTITKPEKTTEYFSKTLFVDVLGEFSTTFASTYYNRAHNIKLAASKIDGTILSPGEVFSYNGIVGPRKISTGFKSAHVFSGNKVVDGIGGGICQVSSTLYNTVLYSDLEVIERSNHSLPVGYVRSGFDATVSYGSLDFKFKNNLRNPIKVVASVIGGKITIQILGINEHPEKSIELKNVILGTIAPTTQTVNDPSLPVGTTKVVSSGSNGYKVAAYKIIKINGKQTDSIKLSTDTYRAQDRIVNVGTKQGGESVAQETFQEPIVVVDESQIEAD